MEITKHWVPFDVALHNSLQSVYPLVEKERYLLTVRARDADGRILAEHQYNDGKPISNIGQLRLDFSEMFGELMQKARVGLTEVEFASERPYTASGCHYFVGPRGFTCFLSGPLPSINQRNPKSKYRGFSVHYVDESVVACGLAVMHVSTNPEYSRVAQVYFNVCDDKGDVVQTGKLEIPPFGTRWIAIDEKVRTSGSQIYTMFANSDNSAMISLIWTHMKGGGLGLDHTQPPGSQIAYGVDMSPGLRNRYLRLRHQIGRKLRYRFNRVDDRPLWSFPSRKA